MRIRLTKLLALLPLFLSLSFIVVAQETTEPFSYGATTTQAAGGPEGVPDDVQDTPINSWLAVLLNAGFLYGV